MGLTLARVQALLRVSRFFTAVVVLAQLAFAPGLTAAPSTNSTWLDAWGASYISRVVNWTNRNVPTFNNSTLRENMFAKLGGTQIRVKFTDRFATNPVVIGEAHVALRSGTTGSSILPGTDHVLTFDGTNGLTLAIGEERWSDPVNLVVTQFQNVTVSIYLPQSFQPSAFHFDAGKTQYYVSGNHCSDASLVSPSNPGHTFFVSGLQVMAPANSRIIVALGDSITDGSCANNDANSAWPDVLSTRLPALSDGTPVGVINMGIGSNRLMSTNAAGPPAVSRLDDDVLSRSNVSHLILLEGVNDISYEHAPSQDLIAAYQQIIDRAHAKGIRIFGATILPIGNSVKYSTANEATRQAVNTWIRSSGQFDAVLDFEQVVRDSDTSPLRIYQNLTCGGTGSCCDYVHPNSQGYLQMAQSIPLSLFNTRLLTFYAPGFDTNGIVHWWMDFDPSLAYVIESSTNLTNWTTNQIVTRVPSIYFSDPDSKTQTLRYFRARQL
jgi:lysophospholipase L1-like esterase